MKFLLLVFLFSFYAQAKTKLESLRVKKVLNVLKSKNVSLKPKSAIKTLETCQDRFGQNFNENQNGFTNCKVNKESTKNQSRSMQYKW